MRIKIFLKKLIAISVAAVSAVTLASCFDLGDFSDESAYYAAFGDIVMVDGFRTEQADGEILREVHQEAYGVQDYFYKDSFNADEETDENKYIPQLPYIYMAIPINADLEVESIALYFKATQTCALEVEFYVVDSLPDFNNIRLLGDPEYQQEQNENTGEILQEKIPYSDPDNTLLVGRKTVQVKENGWASVVVENGRNERFAMVEEDQYLLLRFVNNSGTYTGTNPTVSFRATNVLLRAFPVSDS